MGSFVSIVRDWNTLLKFERLQIATWCSHFPVINFPIVKAGLEIPASEYHIRALGGNDNKVYSGVM